MRKALILCGALSWTTLGAGCADINIDVLRDALDGHQAAVSSSLPLGTALAAAPTDGSPVDDGSRTDAADAQPAWLAMGAQLAAEAETRSVAPPEGPGGTGRPFVPYAERRGPAYPGDVWHSLGRDAKEFLPLVWDDTKATATNPVSLVCLGLAVGGVALFDNNGDDQVERHFRKHGGGLNGFWDTVGDVGGNPGTHFAIAGAMYFASYVHGDTKTYEVSKTMLSGLAINGIATVALKAVLRTESPNGDEYGWPSGHTSSTFCLATILHESYGPWLGIPAYAFAAFVGYERIDARNHDFSDVISGALIGIAIGHAVSQNHQPKILGMDVIPYVDPRGGAGLALAKRW